MEETLYNLFTTDSTTLYPEYRTEYVLNLKGVDALLLDEDFIDLYGYDVCFGNDISGFKLSEPDSRGSINLIIQYTDEDGEPEEETVFCLVPMKSFIKH